MKAKKGWKVVGITGYNANYDPKTIKNGKTILKKKDRMKAVLVEFENKKTEQRIWLVMHCKGFAVDF